MPTEAVLPDIEALASEFIGLPSERLPRERDLLAQSLVAEALRFGIFSRAPDSSSWPRAHILALRNWVIRKFRSVFARVGLKVEEFVSEVLSDSLGPSLENLGDFISLPDGYYSPAPTRVLPIESDNWIVVSGRPSKEFLDAGFQLKIHGSTRWITDSSRDRFDSVGIPVQARESYVGDIWSIAEPTRFLYDCFDSGLARLWIAEAGSQAYVGRVGGRRGFEWGSQAAKAATARGDFSVWKSPREFDRFDYLLRFDSKSVSRGVLLPRSLTTHALLAIDASIHQAREAAIETGDTMAILGLDFYPPAPQMRWIYAMGGVFHGFSGSRYQWRLPKAATGQVVEFLRAMWLEVRSTGAGQK